MMQKRELLKRIASVGASHAVVLLRPLHVKLKIMRSRLPICGMTSADDRNGFGRSDTVDRGNMTVCPAWTCLAMSLFMN